MAKDEDYDYLFKVTWQSVSLWTYLAWLDFFWRSPFNHQSPAHMLMFRMADGLNCVLHLIDVISQCRPLSSGSPQDWANFDFGKFNVSKTVSFVKAIVLSIPTRYSSYFFFQFASDIVGLQVGMQFSIWSEQVVLIGDSGVGKSNLLSRFTRSANKQISRKVWFFWLPIPGCQIAVFALLTIPEFRAKSMCN